MKLVGTLTLWSIALAAAAPLAAAPASAAAAAAGVTGCPPTALALRHVPGTATGVLSWRGPRGAYVVSSRGRRLGSTRTHRLRVPARLGRSYRLTVRRIGRGGRCAATRRVAVLLAPPSAPRRLTVRIAGGQARLTWRASRRGDGVLAGYRVTRDGRTLRQVRTTQIAVAIAAGRTYRIAVRAVDTRGNLSAPARVTISSSLRSPSVPQDLRVVSVSDSAATLAWDAASPGSGRVTGYRVFRDGVVVGQPTGTTITVPRLETARDYSFAVAAVNSFGYVSAPSDALTVSTELPPRTTGSAHAFLLATTDNSFEDFRSHYQQIGTVYPTYFQCNRSTAEIEGADDPLVTRFARLRQVQVLPRMDCQDTATVHRILTDGATRQRWLDGMVARATQYGYDGVSIDFEAGPATDRAAYTAFAAEFAGRLHAVGKRLTLVVSAKLADSLTHPRSGIFDYPALANIADHLFVMAWGVHWATSNPGPIADWSWYTKVLDYVAQQPNPSRFVIGLPLYGMDWPNGGGAASPATALEHADATAVAARVGAAPQYDAAAHEMRFAYQDAAGSHEVWFMNAATVLERAATARQRGFGVGLWRLGREDQALWEGLG